MIMALDLASRQSGWAVFDNDGSLVEYGIIAPKPLKLTARQRLPIIMKEIQAVIDKHGIKEMILEEPAGGKEDSRGAGNNWLTMSVLFITHGAVALEMERQKIKYSIISPSTWQNRLAIFKRDRAGRKAGAKDYAITNYKLADTLEQDIYDAVCLYDCKKWLDAHPPVKKEEDLQWR